MIDETFDRNIKKEMRYVGVDVSYYFIYYNLRQTASIVLAQSNYLCGTVTRITINHYVLHQVKQTRLLHKSVCVCMIKHNFRDLYASFSRTSMYYNVIRYI